MRVLVFLFLYGVVRSLQADDVQLIWNIPSKSPSARCHTRICKVLVSEIQKSQHSIQFALYGLRGQPSVLEALRAARHRGVKIEGVVDMNVENKNYYTDTPKLLRLFPDTVTDYETDLMTAKKQKPFFYRPRCSPGVGFNGPAQCLTYRARNVCIAAALASREKIQFDGEIMHNKFFIFDEKIVWTGSSNVSDTGTGGYNANLVFLIHSKGVAEAYRKQFLLLRQGVFHQEKTRSTRTIVSIGEKSLEVLFSPTDRPDARIVQLIRNAQQSIDVAIFYLTHKAITKELIAAHERGVSVRVIVDATSAANGYSKHQILRYAGIPVKVENWGGKMHAKAAQIDGKIVIGGSMNWTRAGGEKNDENTIIFHDSALAKQFLGGYNRLWKSIPRVFLQSDPRAEGKESSTACSDGVDNDYDDQIDSADSDCSRKNYDNFFQGKLTVYPALADCSNQETAFSAKDTDLLRRYPNALVRVEGKVQGIYCSRKFCALNFSKNYRKGFKVIFFEQSMKNMNLNERRLRERYLHKKVFVKGRLKLYRGQPEVIVYREWQLERGG